MFQWIILQILITQNLQLSDDNIGTTQENQKCFAHNKFHRS